MTGKCIGECYGKDQKALHPLTLEVLINDLDNKYCPSQPNIDSFKRITEYNLCDSKSAPQFKEIAKIMYTPEITFNSKSFLYLFNINSFTTAILWANIYLDEDKPILTILRNLNVAWKVYHKKVIKINDEIVECYMKIYIRYLNLYNFKDLKLLKKIIKRSLKKFLRETNSWDSLDFNSLNIIKKYIIRYINKYKK
jgi:hypothetical protein